MLVEYRSETYYDIFLGVKPGIAFGYSYSFLESFITNFSVGYALTSIWDKSSLEDWDNWGYISLTYYPELKYQISEHWCLSLLINVDFTSTFLYIFPDLFNGTMYSNTYLVVSYYWP